MYGGCNSRAQPARNTLLINEAREARAGEFSMIYKFSATNIYLCVVCINDDFTWLTKSTTYHVVLKTNIPLTRPRSLGMGSHIRTNSDSAKPARCVLDWFSFLEMPAKSGVSADPARRDSPIKQRRTS